MGQDKFRRKSGCAKATQYDPRGSTAIVYFNTVQCSPKFMAIIVASTNIAVPYRYLDTAVASHAHGHAWHVCPVYIAILYSHGHHQLESSLRRLNFVLDQIIRRCRAPKWWLSLLAWQLATQDWPHIDFFSFPVSRGDRNIAILETMSKLCSWDPAFWQKAHLPWIAKSTWWWAAIFLKKNRFQDEK